MALFLLAVLLPSCTLGDIERYDTIARPITTKTSIELVMRVIFNEYSIFLDELQKFIRVQIKTMAFKRIKNAFMHLKKAVNECDHITDSIAKNIYVLIDNKLHNVFSEYNLQVQFQLASLYMSNYLAAANELNISCQAHTYGRREKIIIEFHSMVNFNYSFTCSSSSIVYNLDIFGPSPQSQKVV